MTLELLGGQLLEYSFTCADRKTMSITVRPDGSVAVRAPADVGLEKVEARLRRRIGWIRRQQDMFESFQPRTPARRYVAGETHRYLGRQYRLKLIAGTREGVRLWAGYMEVTLRDPADSERVRKLLWSWYRAQAERYFPPLLAHWLDRFPRQGLPESRLLIRRGSQRWGSCSASGTITLNLDLIRAPRSSIEYVLVHELCHFCYPSHSRQFFALLESVLPDWRDRKQRLERVMV
jgi:hypothetical protein